MAADARDGSAIEDFRRARPGSTLDEILAAEGILEEATEHSVKSVLAWQIPEAMRRLRLTKAAMAREMRTRRTRLVRLLDPDNASVTLHSLHRAAAILGKRLHVDLAS